MRRVVTPALTLALALVLAVAGSTVAAPATVAPAPASADAPLRYVALGDSYSAASGVLPLDPGAPLPCLRSTRNYPHVLAGRIGATLRDVTCGAADTGDYTAAQYPGVPPQLDALRPDTQLVTMTIGGNDSNVFVGAILACGVLGTVNLGQGSPCRDTYGDSFERTIRDTTYPALVGALSAVRQRAPRARVLIIGYPWILPPTGGCFPVMPVSSGDVPYLRSLQTTLDDAVSRAAAATGSAFVDTAGTSEGHDACRPRGTRWIEPVLTGTNPVIVHPNALGEAKIAEQVLAVLARVAPGLVAGSGARSATTTRQRLGGARDSGRARALVATVRTGAGQRVPGIRVVLQSRRAGSGGSWRTIRTRTTADDGRATARPRPRGRTAFRWKAEPTAIYAGSTSGRIVLRR